MRTKETQIWHTVFPSRGRKGAVRVLVTCLFTLVATAYAQPPVKLTLDQAIDLALKHNHTRCV